MKVLSLMAVEVTQLEGALTGMDFVGSCLAIWNIASFERSCEELLEGFRVESKFISVKVLWAAYKRFEISKFKFKFPRARTYELIRARSRLYQSQLVQVNTRWNQLSFRKEY